ncbi:uncharacterized protein LOC112083994 [Eutrema salsugineum]|uniref:uncharacterized protein LOC112083994 n=1 Tax=Eutrema salsugineum TaxID=72664 RepID=UPI000CED7F44|nr:uncharacterized protein LOC112083994 [Eutrema salsugineum]
MVGKLKPILPSLILHNQTAFVKGRLLVENTVLAGEIVSGYHKETGPKRITIKVDIAKAFDTLSWDFLFNCLQGILLPDHYIRCLKACVCTTNFTLGYNGAVHGYFKGKRGLRQGDPLSPYLFVIAMNCLSLMLNQAALDGKFQYHHQCEGTKLTHLCFADDLLIFIDGSLSSVQNVLQVLREFELRSGLAVSIHKSCFFSAGLSPEEVQNITETTGLSPGTLPMRYLGVPLCTKKLSIANCEPLLQQIKGKISSWSVKTLSFAGRLQLLNTVIAGITNFWCSNFVLPKLCIRKINSLCSAFLWKGTVEGHHTARISWDQVTMQKSEGGLSIRNLYVWNKACIIKLLWLLFFQSGSVWVAWFKERVLKGNVNNLWSAKLKQTNSWFANKIIKSREEAYDWIKLRVGNGRSCLFWTDNWSPFGNLQKFLQSVGDRRLGIAANTTLANLYCNGGWMLPSPRSERQLSLHIHMTTLQLTREEDNYEWEIDGKVSTKYSTGQVYHLLRNTVPKVPWRSIVWNQGGTPRHSFFTWMLILNRCPTRDRIANWGLTTDTRCLLCDALPESRDHIYFDCSFSWSVWEPIARRCNYSPIRSWGHSIADLQSLTAPKDKKWLIILAWQNTLYLLWTERNHRLHRQLFRSPDALILLNDSYIRNKASSYRDSNNDRASSLLQLWLSTAPSPSV